MTHTLEIFGTLLFALAVLHTFAAAKILQFSHRFPKGSGREALFHLLGEVEVVFGLWGGLLLGVMAFLEGPRAAINYQESLHFSEPIFVFCIMVMAATKPIMGLAQHLIRTLGSFVSRVFKVPAVLADVFVILTVGPLSGSFITEPAAMTVTALLLNSLILHNERKILYAILGVLFVNVSVGGALTPFAAPPILMVAGVWKWDFAYVFTHFGWKSVTAVIGNALFLVGAFAQPLQKNLQSLSQVQTQGPIVPTWVTGLHYLFLLGLVLCARYPAMAVGIFLLFLGLVSVTGKFHERLRLRESLLVAFFLGGIILFGAFQKWWLAPLLASLGPQALYLGACALTAVTDNAALTYLGSQVEGLSSVSQYYLVAGALAGGGLTIIANAPNAAGFSVFQKRLEGGLNPLSLFLAALVPTAIAILSLGYFPDF